VNLSLEVINLVVSVHELNLIILQLLTLLQFHLQVCDHLCLHSLELLQLMGLSSGGLLCLPRKVMVMKYVLVVLGRVMLDGQELLVLVVKVTLQICHLLAHVTILLGHTADLLGKGLDLLGITTNVTPLSCNEALGVMLQLELVMGIACNIRPTTLVVVLKDVACLIHACLPLCVRAVLDRVQ
jgi:hypothetical protein